MKFCDQYKVVSVKHSVLQCKYQTLKLPIQSVQHLITVDWRDRGFFIVQKEKINLFLKFLLLEYNHFEGCWSFSISRIKEPLVLYFP